MRKNNSRTILAIDPGLQEMGYAILRGRSLVDQNVISFDGVNHRLPAARSAIRELVRRHGPTELVVEQTHRYSNGLHRLIPALERVAKERRIKLSIYSPKTVRKHLVANGWAGKAETASAMAHRYPHLKVYR